MHQDTANWHVPLLQVFEQHSEPVWHWLPDVLQLSLSATHFPELQLPPQHSAEEAQVPWSEMHAAAEHLLLTQLNPQHSVAV